LELYGLCQALNATKLWLIGAKELVVEVDAQYIKGMLMSQTSFGHISINSSSILTVSTAMESP